MFWDYLGSNPESIYQVMRLFSDLGTPYGFRFMNGWSGHTYRWVKENGDWVYVKISAETQQGVRGFSKWQIHFRKIHLYHFVGPKLYERRSDVHFR